MKRRKFIKKSGVLGIATILPVPYFSIVKKQQKTTPADYGAIGDGVADDTQAILDWGAWAFDVANTDPVLYLDRNANYYTTGNLLFNIEKAFVLDGRKAKITRDYANAPATNNFGLSFNNSLYTTDKVLAANVQKGDMTIELTDNTDIAVGQGMTFIGGILLYDEPSGTTYTKGWMSIVTAINGTVISLQDPSPIDFTVGEDTLCRFRTPYPITIKNVSFNSLNHLDKYRAGEVRHLMLSNFFYPTVQNIKFETPAYMILQTKNIYGGLFENIQTTHNYTNLGVYGISPSFNVNTLYKNINIKSNSHCITLTGTASYKVEFRDMKVESGVVGGDAYSSFDSHIALDVEATNCDLYGTWWGHGLLLVENSRVYADLGNDYIFGWRGAPESRQCNFVFNNNDILSDGYVHLIKGGEKIEEISDITFSNNIFDNEDLRMLPYMVNIFTGNTMSFPGTTYNLPDNNSWTEIHPASYYDFSAATEGITTQVNLNGLSGFSMLVRAKLNDLEAGNSVLAAANVGSINFWFRIVKTTGGGSLSVRILDANGGTTCNMSYIFDLNVRTYGFTFDGNKEVRFYVDGFFIGKVDYTGGAYAAKDHFLTIGKRGNALSDGSIDQVMFYERTLNQEEVVLATSTPANVPDYKMYLGPNKTNTVWFDESSNGNNGTVGDAIVLVP